MCAHYGLSGNAPAAFSETYPLGFALGCPHLLICKHARLVFTYRMGARLVRLLPLWVWACHRLLLDGDGGGGVLSEGFAEVYDRFP